MALLTDHDERQPGRDMLVLGVTGGMGSGKSVVCAMLEERGARVFDADRVGKELLSQDPGARAEILREFGRRSYRTDGSLDRAYLAGIVFNDPERLAAINAIVHPRVFEAFARTREVARRDGVRLLVHEAALLFEAGGDRHVDLTVYVDAPRWLRVRRVRERDGRTRREILSRMAHQLPAYRGRERADFVLRNDGDLDRLAERVDRLLLELERRHGLRMSAR